MIVVDEDDQGDGLMSRRYAVVNGILDLALRITKQYFVERTASSLLVSFLQYMWLSKVACLLSSRGQHESVSSTI